MDISSTVTINSVQVKVEHGLNITEIIEEKLDSGGMTLPVSTKKESYEPLSDVSIILQQTIDSILTTKTFKMVVDSDQPRNLGASPYTLHKVNLIEETKKLEKYRIGNLSIQQLRNTAGTITVLDTVFKVLNKLTYYEGVIITLSANAVTILSAGNTRMPQRTYKGLNVREILNDVFLVKNGIPRLKDGVLDIDLMNKKGNLITIPHTFLYNSKRDSSEYLSKFRSTLLNSANNKDLDAGSFWYPSTTTYAVPRAPLGGQGKFTESTAIIQLAEDMPLNDFTKFYVLVPTQTLGVLLLDATDYLVPKTDYDLLPRGSHIESTLVTEKAQANSLWFELNGHEIGGLGETSGLLNNVPATDQIYKTLLHVNGYSWTSEFKSGIIREFKVRLFSSPLKDIEIEIVRSKIKYNTKEATKLINQRSSSVEIETMGDYLYSVANRTGNPEIIQGVIIKDLRNMIEVGDYLATGEIVMNVDTVVYNGFLLQRPYLLDEFNRLHQMTQIANMKREYNIDPNCPTNNVAREFLEFSFTNKTNTGTRLTDLGKKIFLNSLDYETTYDRPINNFFYYNANVNPDVITHIGGNVLGVGYGNSMVFTFGFNSANIAGYQLVSYFNGISTVYKNKAIKYTEDDGSVFDAKIILSDDMPNNTFSEAEYPYVTAPLSINEIINMPQHLLRKNSGEIMKDAVSLHVVSDIDVTDRSNYFIIGDALIKDNNLVKALGSGKNIGIYLTSETYGEFDKYAVKGTLSGIPYILNKTDGKITLGSHPGQSWAIGDDDGNLYLASNVAIIPNTNKEIFLNTLEFRTGLDDL